VQELDKRARMKEIKVRKLGAGGELGRNQGLENIENPSSGIICV